MSRVTVVLGALLVVALPARVCFGDDGKDKSQDKNPDRAEIDRLKKEVKTLVEQLKKRELMILRLKEEVEKIRSEAVTARNVMEATKERLQESLKQAQIKDRMIAELKARSGEKPAKKPNDPPPESIKGTITKVEPKSGLVEINLGTDAGLKRNHTLEVFRLKPRAEYLGRIQLVEVSKTKSVGRLITPLRPGQVLQAGDSVASKFGE
jgi:hypothetical protein